MFCEYKNLFGEVNKGVHSIRIPYVNLALVDTLLTIIVSGIISVLFDVNFWLVLLILFLLGIILHRLFCVNTTIDKLLFGKDSNFK